MKTLFYGALNNKMQWDFNIIFLEYYYIIKRSTAVNGTVI